MIYSTAMVCFFALVALCLFGRGNFNMFSFLCSAKFQRNYFERGPHKALIKIARIY